MHGRTVTPMPGLRSRGVRDSFPMSVSGGYSYSIHLGMVVSDLSGRLDVFFIDHISLFLLVPVTAI